MFEHLEFGDYYIIIEFCKTSKSYKAKLMVKHTETEHHEIDYAIGLNPHNALWFLGNKIDKYISIE